MPSLTYQTPVSTLFLPNPGVGYLGGSDKIDVNNANVRVYARFPGMYPSAAGKIVSHGPYKSVGDLYNIPGLSGACLFACLPARPFDATGAGSG